VFVGVFGGVFVGVGGHGISPAADSAPLAPSPSGMTDGSGSKQEFPLTWMLAEGPADPRSGMKSNADTGRSNARSTRTVSKRGDRITSSTSARAQARRTNERPCRYFRAVATRASGPMSR
jgi:hypothetical protein